MHAILPETDDQTPIGDAEPCAVKGPFQHVLFAPGLKPVSEIGEKSPVLLPELYTRRRKTNR